MLSRLRPLLLLCALLAGQCLAQSAQPSAGGTAPKVRAITAFIRLQRSTYKAQVADALKMLRAAKEEFTRAGYEVETIRITTQPFPEYTKGLTTQQALDFFREYDKLAEQ